MKIITLTTMLLVTFSCANNEEIIAEYEVSKIKRKSSTTHALQFYTIFVESMKEKYPDRFSLEYSEIAFQGDKAVIDLSKVAKKDLDEGKVNYFKPFDSPKHNLGDFKKYFKKKHSIEIILFKLSVTSHVYYPYFGSYNKVVSEYLVEKYGADIVKQEDEKRTDEYISQNQDKVVIAVFTANWGATGPLLEKAIDDKSIKKYLAKFPVKIFIYNCTENDSIGSQQVQKYGLKASPTALVIKKPNQEEIWIRPSIKVEELLNQLKKEMEQS